MNISHGFGLRAHDLIGLFDKTNKISTFMNKLEKQSLIDPLRYDSTDNHKKGIVCMSTGTYLFCFKVFLFTKFVDTK